MVIKAIETVYRGFRFRSRLEADWAANLDKRGIPWIYEPEGYQLSDHTWYSPDFWLPSAKAWLEVKGSHNQRISKVEQFAVDLWEESGCTSTYDPGAPMVLVGREPHTFRDHHTLAMTGVMGHGKAYSVGILTCRNCSHATVVALWQPKSRCCGFILEPPEDFQCWPPSHNARIIKQYRGAVYDNFDVEFIRLPRPAGRAYG